MEAVCDLEDDFDENYVRGGFAKVLDNQDVGLDEGRDREGRKAGKAQRESRNQARTQRVRCPSSLPAELLELEKKPIEPSVLGWMGSKGGEEGKGVVD